MFFTANDSIKLNMSRDDAIKLFEKTFYDMHKAGIYAVNENNTYGL